MDTKGPICPKCQKALPYRFAFRLFNPYDFRCPHCTARLRCRLITFEIVVYAIVGFLITAPVFRFYIATWAWTTPVMIAYMAVCFPIVTLVSHFIFWKTDTLIHKDDA